jgi:hypothetical protein
MSRAGKEPAEDVKRRLIAACAEVGQKATAVMRLVDDQRLICVDTPTVSLIARVPISGEWPATVDVRCGTPEGVFGPWLRGPTLVPFDELVPMLRRTLDERERVIAAMQLGIEGPFRFEGSEWSEFTTP